VPSPSDSSFNKKVEDEELKVGDSEVSNDAKSTPNVCNSDEATIFICDNFMDFMLWRKALESYVVQ